MFDFGTDTITDMVYTNDGTVDAHATMHWDKLDITSDLSDGTVYWQKKKSGYGLSDVRIYTANVIVHTSGSCKGESRHRIAGDYTPAENGYQLNYRHLFTAAAHETTVSIEWHDTSDVFSAGDSLAGVTQDNDASGDPGNSPLKELTTRPTDRTHQVMGGLSLTDSKYYVLAQNGSGRLTTMGSDLVFIYTGEAGTPGADKPVKGKRRRGRRRGGRNIVVTGSRGSFQSAGGGFSARTKCFSFPTGGRRKRRHEE
jgi:hypothetical protein